MSDPDAKPAEGPLAPASQHDPRDTLSHASDTSDTSDAELVLRARQDQSEFAVLYRRYLPRVYRFLLARLGDVQQAQDTTAQTFLAALEGLPNYRGQGPFIAWLLSIARHKAADLCRERRASVSLEAVADLPPTIPSPERVVVARLELEDVVRVRRVLAPERAEALALRLFAGLNLAEAAAVMDKNEAAVKMLVHRAVRDLRDRLAYRSDADA